MSGHKTRRTQAGPGSCHLPVTKPEGSALRGPGFSVHATPVTSGAPIYWVASSAVSSVDTRNTQNNGKPSCGKAGTDERTASIESSRVQLILPQMGLPSAHSAGATPLPPQLSLCPSWGYEGRCSVGNECIQQSSGPIAVTGDPSSVSSTHPGSSRLS